MKKLTTDNIVSEINLNVFFKEFTFNKNDFVESNNKIEFADNIVWLDRYFFIYQVKTRESEGNRDDSAWFENKVLKKAVKQIKSTIKYLCEYPSIRIKNERGHTIDISEARDINPRKIIIYTPLKELPQEKRFLKFYVSRKVGLIHLFHSEDYYWICRYLITPAEIDEYLEFREEFYSKHKLHLNRLPEQYLLGHFFETLSTDFIEPHFIENLIKIEKEIADFNISALIENFAKHIVKSQAETDYYKVLKEIAKLNRSEMAEFKRRYSLSWEMCRSNTFVKPYVFYSPRTDCGFVFIPIPQEKCKHWKTAINNFTQAFKYDRRATKCIGVLMMEMVIDNQVSVDIYWEYLEFNWVYDEQLDFLLKTKYPFGKIITKEIINRYKSK